MNRLKHAAILCAIAALFAQSPAMAAFNSKSAMQHSSLITVKSHFPADMDINVSPDSPLTAEFSGAVNQSFYESINFNLFTKTMPVEGELFYNPAARQVMFKPKALLQPSQAYTARLTYFDGLGRATEKLWSFKTGESNRLSSLNSANTAASSNAQSTNNLVLTNASMGSGGITSELPLEISFSDAIDITTLKVAPVQLFADNKPVGIDYRLSRDMKTITISPRQSLQSGVSYMVTVDKTLASASGKRLAKKTLIPFKVDSADAAVDRHIIEEREAAYANASQMGANQAYANASQMSAKQAYANASQMGANQAYANASQMSANCAYANASQMSANQGSASTQNNVRQIGNQAFNQPMTSPNSTQVELVALAPQNGVRVTNLAQPVTIGFSGEIIADTLNEFTFRLEDDFGPVPAKIHYFKGRKQATLTPIGLLENNKGYRVVVTQGVSDINGRPIKNGISSCFSTASSDIVPASFGQSNSNAGFKSDTAELEAIDNAYASYSAANNTPRQGMQNYAAANAQMQGNYAFAANKAQRDMQKRSTNAGHAVNARQKPAREALNSFRVTSIYPGENASNIARRSKIAVHFSEDADPKTINNINISMFANQTRVNGRVVYDRKNKRAIFEPDSQLDAKTDYKVLVSDKIKSRMGEPLCKRFSWVFSTTENTPKRYFAKRGALEADASFYIPLVDGKIKANHAQYAPTNKKTTSTGSKSSFTFVPSRHWSFKSMRHIANKGIIDEFPFAYTDKVTRYEFAGAVGSALSSLKDMQSSGKKTRLRLADMVELEKLVIEYRSELKTYNINLTWFENFLTQQGINLPQIEQKVNQLSRARL